MKRVLFSLLAAVVALQASQLTHLFDALKKQPVTKVDELLVKSAKLNRQKVVDKFFPSINLFATYEYYNSYTNLRPVPPTEANSLIAQHQPLPFAKNIQRVGASVSMPLFVKELFTIKKKMKHIVKLSKLKRELDIYTNEAIILGAYANLNYLQNLTKSLEARVRSLQKTHEDLAIKVQTGRAAPVALDKIDSALDALKIAIGNVQTNEAKIRQQIEALTGIELQKATNIEKVGRIDEESFLALKIFDQKCKSAELDLQAAKEQFLPKLLLEGKWSENYAQKDVLLGRSVHRGYGDITLKLVLPLSKEKWTDIELAKVNLLKEQTQKSQTKIELESKAKSLKKQLQVLQHMQKLAKSRVQKAASLLRYAKTAFKVGRMIEEEYLRYEEGLLTAQSKLYEIEAKQWQLLGQLAVMYGNDLERIVQ